MSFLGRLKVKRYVVGFAFSETFNYVALVNKKRPAWQVGKWNGVGGKVEPGEWPLDAMVREFDEECSIELTGPWRLVCRLISPNILLDRWRVDFFCATFDYNSYSTMRNFGKTDEIVEVLPVDVIGRKGLYPVRNLPYLMEIAKLVYCTDHSSLTIFED